MHAARALRINVDLASAAALLIGIVSVSFLALNGF
jgi:hypothetical protein